MKNKPETGDTGTFKSAQKQNKKQDVNQTMDSENRRTLTVQSRQRRQRGRVIETEVKQEWTLMNRAPGLDKVKTNIQLVFAAATYAY